MNLGLKLLVVVGIVAAIAYIAICILLWRLQNRLMFVPSRVLDTNPGDLQLQYKDVWLPVSAGDKKVKVDRVKADRANAEGLKRIHGWWIDSPPSASFGGTAKVLLFLHGNAENISGNLDHASKFQKFGFSVLIVDYRGYGISDGSFSDGGFPTEKSVYQDVETAWNYLVEERGISPEQIVIYGHSLGGAIAIELASHHPEADSLIIEGTFTCMRDMADYQYSYLGIFPIDLLLKNHFASMNKVGSLKMPVLFIHGQDDDVVPYWMSEALFEVASEPKQLLLVPGADHNNVASLSGEEYWQAVRRLVERVETRV